MNEHPRTIIVLSVALALGLVGVAYSYTATIVDAQVSGNGTALTITICWTSGEAAPTRGNTQAEAWEIDNPPLDPHDPLGRDVSGTPVGDPWQEGNMSYQNFVFVFPRQDCEQGDEEFSATVTIGGLKVPANGAGGHPFSKNIC
jgi:hypothetical protein